MAQYREISIFLLGFFLSLVIVIIASKLNIIDLSFKQYAYINTEKVIEDIENYLKDEEFIEEEISNKLIYAKDIFKREIKFYSKKHNAVIFTSSKVISGANDITNKVTFKVIDSLK